MFEVQENGQVLKVTEVKTPNQTVIEKTDYDMEHHTRLRYENQKVIAEVYNYLDEFQFDYNDDIIFEYEGERIIVQAVNGVAEIEFQAETSLECTVKTAVPKFRNGEVTFNV